MRSRGDVRSTMIGVVIATPPSVPPFGVLDRIAWSVNPPLSSEK